MNLDFPKSCEVLGGYPEFRFVEISNIDFLQKSKSLINKEILLKSDIEWSIGFSNAKTLELIIETETRSGSKVLDVKIEGFISSNDNNSTLLEIFDKMTHGLFVVMVEDDNVNKLVGTMQTPLKFIYNFSSGKSAKDPKGYKFSFFNKMLIYPRVYCPI